MKIEELERGQYFILDQKKHRAHSVMVVSHDINKTWVYVETSTGTLLCERPGVWVEPATASTEIKKKEEWTR